VIFANYNFGKITTLSSKIANYKIANCKSCNLKSANYMRWNAILEFTILDVEVQYKNCNFPNFRIAKLRGLWNSYVRGHRNCNFEHRSYNFGTKVKLQLRTLKLQITNCKNFSIFWVATLWFYTFALCNFAKSRLHAWFSTFRIAQKCNFGKCNFAISLFCKLQILKIANHDFPIFRIAQKCKMQRCNFEKLHKSATLKIASCANSKSYNFLCCKLQKCDFGISRLTFLILG
jgi:hypothetical protein